MIYIELTHPTTRKKVLKNAFVRIRGASVNIKMYSPIPVYDKICGFDVPSHKDEKRILRYTLKIHILDKGLTGMSVCLHIHSTGGNRVIFFAIFIITNKKEKIK